MPAGGQPIALSEAVALPQHDALNLEVLTIAAGAADVTADDFTDVSPKTYGLPKTTVTVEKDAGGVQHVYLSARITTRSTARPNCGRTIGPPMKARTICSSTR